MNLVGACLVYGLVERFTGQESSIVVEKCIFNNFTGVNGGLAIDVKSDYLKIKQCSFSHCHALSSTSDGAVTAYSNEAFFVYSCGFDLLAQNGALFSNKIGTSNVVIEHSSARTTESSSTSTGPFWSHSRTSTGSYINTTRSINANFGLGVYLRNSDGSSLTFTHVCLCSRGNLYESYPTTTVSYASYLNFINNTEVTSLFRFCSEAHVQHCVFKNTGSRLLANTVTTVNYSVYFSDIVIDVEPVITHNVITDSVTIGTAETHKAILITPHHCNIEGCFSAHFTSTAMFSMKVAPLLLFSSLFS